MEVPKEKIDIMMVDDEDRFPVLGKVTPRKALIFSKRQQTTRDLIKRVKEKLNIGRGEATSDQKSVYFLHGHRKCPLTSGDICE